MFKCSDELRAASNSAALTVIETLSNVYGLEVEVATAINVVKNPVYGFGIGEPAYIQGSVWVTQWEGRKCKPASWFFPSGNNDPDARMIILVEGKTPPPFPG